MNESPEWQYRYEERLAILCGNGQPTPQQVDLAIREADEAVKELNYENRINAGISNAVD